MPLPRHIWQRHRGRMAQLVPVVAWGMQGPVPPVPQSLSMQMVGRGVAGGCPPPVPSWPSRRSPRRRPGEDSGGGGGGWAGCLHCRHPPRAGPALHRGSVGMTVSGVDTDPMHPAPPYSSTACPQKCPPWGHPAPCHPGAAPALQPEVTKYRIMPSLALRMTSLPPGGDAALALSLQPPGQPTPTGVPGP